MFRSLPDHHLPGDGQVMTETCRRSFYSFRQYKYFNVLFIKISIECNLLEYKYIRNILFLLLRPGTACHCVGAAYCTPYIAPTMCCVDATWSGLGRRGERNLTSRFISKISVELHLLQRNKTSYK
jgi:hypothetical protein